MSTTSVTPSSRAAFVVGEGTLSRERPEERVDIHAVVRAAKEVVRTGRMRLSPLGEAAIREYEQMHQGAAK